MNIESLILELAVLYVAHYKLTYTLYAKKLLRINQWRMIKPFDCFHCSAMWLGAISSYWHCNTVPELCTRTATALILGVLIEGSTEK